MAKTAVVHDHIVLLLNQEDFRNPPQWLSSNFHIIEGGTHKGGSSSNKLIVFKDGTYLELFTWIASPTEFIDWAEKTPGLIDFAVTTLEPVSAEDIHAIVNENLAKFREDHRMGVSYPAPTPGARKRADGTEVKWKSSRPSFERLNNTPPRPLFPNGRIDAPFFCHDITPRTTRVPFEDENVTSHPCGAVGISSVEVFIPSSHLGLYVELYGAILNTVPSANYDGRAKFKIGVPNPDPEDSVETHVALVCEDWDQVSIDFLLDRGIGIANVIFKTGGVHEKPVESLVTVALGEDSIGSRVKLLK